MIVVWTHLQGAVEDPDQVKLFVDFVVLTASDERRSEVSLAAASGRRQAGCFQMVVEMLHLISRFLWKQTRGGQSGKAAVVTETRCVSRCLPWTTFSSASSTWSRGRDAPPPASSSLGRSSQDRRSLPPESPLLLLLLFLLKVPSEVLLLLLSLINTAGGIEEQGEETDWRASPCKKDLKFYRLCEETTSVSSVTRHCLTHMCRICWLRFGGRTTGSRLVVFIVLIAAFTVALCTQRGRQEVNAKMWHRKEGRNEWINMGRKIQRIRRWREERGKVWKKGTDEHEERE